MRPLALILVLLCGCSPGPSGIDGSLPPPDAGGVDAGRPDAGESCDQTAYTRGLREGRLQYLEPKAVECLNGYGQGSCEAPPPACEVVFAGTVPPDAGCILPEECNAGESCGERQGFPYCTEEYFCRQDTSLPTPPPGTCQLRGGLGRSAPATAPAFPRCAAARRSPPRPAWPGPPRGTPAAATASVSRGCTARRRPRAAPASPATGATAPPRAATSSVPRPTSATSTHLTACTPAALVTRSARAAHMMGCVCRMTATTERCPTVGTAAPALPVVRRRPTAGSDE